MKTDLPLTVTDLKKGAETILTDQSELQRLNEKITQLNRDRINSVRNGTTKAGPGEARVNESRKQFKHFETILA